MLLRLTAEDLAEMTPRTSDRYVTAAGRRTSYEFPIQRLEPRAHSVRLHYGDGRHADGHVDVPCNRPNTVVLIDRTDDHTDEETR